MDRWISGGKRGDDEMGLGKRVQMLFQATFLTLGEMNRCSGVHVFLCFCFCFWSWSWVLLLLLKELAEGSEGRRNLTHFLFVLICPTWPQFAHFRWVPPVFAGVEGVVPSAGDSPVDPLAAPFCFSRAKRRSLLRLRRLNSASRL